MNTNFKNNSTNSLSINQEINTIFRFLKASVPSGMNVSKKSPGKYDSFTSIIDISINPDDHRRPTLRYTFYPSTYRPELLGSVAIYAEDADQIYVKLKRLNYLFGYRIKNISLEIGRRPFVDVTLRV